jgi:hypothetical protein
MNKIFFSFFSLFLLTLGGCTKSYAPGPLLSTPCGEAYPSDVVAQLLSLSDTATLQTVPDLEFRLRRISDIFAAYQDPRGTFPSVYRATTEFAVLSVADGAYTDEARAIRLSVAFGKRYLFNLHDYLKGKIPEYHWKQYYDLSQRCGFSKTRIAVAGINAHLTVDLARAVADAAAGPDFEADYITFGEILGNATPNIVLYLRENFGMETAYLFSGLFLGDILDPVFGSGFTTLLGFQFIRGEAFQYGQYLQKPPAYHAAQKKLFEIWELREGLLDELLRQGLLD